MGGRRDVLDAESAAQLTRFQTAVLTWHYFELGGAHDTARQKQLRTVPQSFASFQARACGERASRVRAAFEGTRADARARRARSDGAGVAQQPRFRAEAARRSRCGVHRCIVHAARRACCSCHQRNPAAWQPRVAQASRTR
jgi:hypothetical protein